MISIYVFSALLVTISVVLVVWHVYAWKATKENQSLDDFQRDFAWRQCRRRSQASGMIGLVGLGLAGYRLILMTRSGIVVTVYILTLGTIAVWIILLAIADLAATQIHYRRLHRREWSDVQSANDDEA